MVEYTYDTWGKKVSTTGTLAGTLGLFQPFRYRGYVYDWETGFYYLQSRYYDPSTGRFISADVLLSTGQGVLGHNCYAYCLGNPVALKDEGGNIPSYAVDEADTATYDEHSYELSIYSLRQLNNHYKYEISKDYIPCSNTNTRCFGYAMKYVQQRAGVVSSIYDSYQINSGGFRGYSQNYELSNVVDDFVKAVHNIAPNAQVIVTNRLADANDDDLVIAARVTGKALFAIDDYHFAIRLKDGTWADKPGQRASRVNHIKLGFMGWNSFPYIVNAYFSEIAYIIIRVNQD